jgi:hypothetical protein
LRANVYCPDSRNAQPLTHGIGEAKILGQFISPKALLTNLGGRDDIHRFVFRYPWPPLSSHALGGINKRANLILGLIMRGPGSEPAVSVLGFHAADMARVHFDLPTTLAEEVKTHSHIPHVGGQ